MWFDVDTVVLVHRPLAEDDSVVRPVEADLDLHVRFPAHHVQTLDVGHISRSFHIPEVDVVLGLRSSEGGDDDGREVFEPHGEAGAALRPSLLHPTQPERRRLVLCGRGGEGGAS